MFSEIRFLSRGGQGGVTSAKMLAYAAHLDDFYVQAIPKYGAERKGAPIFTDVRISNKPVQTHAPVIQENADSWIIFDPSVVDSFLTKDQKVKTGSIFVVNTTTKPDFGSNTKVGTVDADNIAKAAGLVKSGTVLVSTVMLGAWAKATGMVNLDSILKAVDKTFGEGSDVAEQNKKAIQMAYEQFMWVN